ncbi:MAG: ABC transporter substrate-binding protein [Propionibacteriaceae bacterium]|nr:ABC transporter substrate-binding protein [Propionibacteriaceae bacterium]
MRLPRLGMIAAIVITMTALLAGCTTSTTGGKTLTVGMTLEPGTLDLSVSDAASIPQLLLYNVYETLVKMDSSGSIEPLLADSYDVSEDSKTYTFHLNGKAKFASGTPVDADAVVASIDRMRDGTSQILKSHMEIVTSVTAVDPATVTVTLREPSNFWLFNMTSTAGIIVDPATEDMATAPMGSGPYVYDSWVKGDRITLKKSSDYWGAKPYYDTVVFRYISDPNAMVSAMLSGDLDIVGEMTSPDSLAQFSDTSKYTIIEGTTNGEVVLGFNHARPALQDVLVRQAICHAIDRQGLVDTVWGGYGELIGTMVVPTDPYYEDLSQVYPYDPDLAKELLAKAGVSNLTLALRIPITPYTSPAATFIASQLGDIGISVTVEELDFSSRWLPEVFLDGDYDMTIVSHVEPRDIVMFADPGYYWNYDNPDFQALIRAADAASPDNFITYMKLAGQMLADDAAADWLFVFPNLLVARAGITGVSQNATSLSFDLTTISATG